MNSWQDRRVLVVGAARQGIALAKYLVAHGARVILNDKRSPEQLTREQDALAGLAIEWALGGHPLELLDRVDLVCLSGGVPLTLPLVQEAMRRRMPLSNDSQVFMEARPCRVIGITGSAGKTTTTTLAGRMCAEATRLGGPWRTELEGIPYPLLRVPAKKSWVGGNIGSPLIAVIGEMAADDLAVMELSSFQLEQMTISPEVVAVLNITPNHLDRHGSMEAYTAAKARLLDFQKPGDVAVLGWDDPGARSLASRVKGKLVTFSKNRVAGQTSVYWDETGIYLAEGERIVKLLTREIIALRGEHNLYNTAAACAIAFCAGVPREAMQAGVSGFGGVAHRLEFVRRWGGADWYNDSIATAPERTMAAIRSFTEPLVLLVGGRDKDLPWEDFARLACERVDHLVLFGEAAGKVVAALEAEASQPGDRLKQIDVCQGLQDAVKAAAEAATPGDVVLLSPGGTSFDEFKDFEERGEAYRKWVQELQ